METSWFHGSPFDPPIRKSFVSTAYPGSPGKSGAVEFNQLTTLSLRN